MTPVNTMTAPTDMPDSLRRELELMSAPNNGALFDMGTTPNQLDSAPAEPAHSIVSSEMTSGEPVQRGDLITSDSVRAIAESTSNERSAQISMIQNIGKRLESLRDSF